MKETLGLCLNLDSEAKERRRGKGLIFPGGIYGHSGISIFQWVRYRHGDLWCQSSLQLRPFHNNKMNY